MRKHTLLLAVFVSCFSSLPLIAQVDTGSLAGTVKDLSGALLPGAAVTPTETATGRSTSVQTNDKGDYVLTPLKIGTYVISVQAVGFKRELRNGISLNVQQNIRLDFSLKVGSVTGETVVSGAQRLLETDFAALGDVVTARQVEDLPLNGRRYTDLATLTAGMAKVVEGPVNGSSTPTNGNAGGDFAVNGRGAIRIISSSTELITTQTITGIWRLLPASTPLQNSGCRLQLFRGVRPKRRRCGEPTTQSGANAVHGSAWEFLRNEVLDARGYFESSDQPKAPY